MSAARLVLVAVSALAFGFLMAVPPGGERRLSIDLWLAGVALWAGVAVAWRAVTVVPTTRAGLRLPLRFRNPPDDPSDRIPRSLVSLESTVLASHENDRAFAHRLRPRLVDLADHRLRVHHGVDPAVEPERARLVLGDTAWLIDPTVTGRTPTRDDLDDFLDRLEPR
jgi:hypothetical protein